MAKRLDEVSFIRPILIILLVLYHSFYIYDGGWKEPAGYGSVEAYKWISRFSYSFFLEMFVFVSGYIFCYQREELGKEDDLWGLMKKKFYRLVVPGFFFSLVYLFLIQGVRAGNIGDVVDLLIQAIGGVGHLWFLPMLFWVFIEAWLFLHLGFSIWWLLLSSFLMLSLSIFSIPLQVGQSAYFLFFFMLGYFAKKKKNDIKGSSAIIVGLWVLFLIVFLSSSFLTDWLNEKDISSKIGKACIMETSVYLKSIYSMIGTAALYVTSLAFCKKISLAPIWVKMGEYCFGVYIFQQFILQILYYQTDLPVCVGYKWLPWLGFILALTFSLLISIVLRMTRVGRFIL